MTLVQVIEKQVALVTIRRFPQEIRQAVLLDKNPEVGIGMSLSGQPLVTE